MSDIRDFTGKNRKFTGTDSIKLPTGTTAQRVDTAGAIRFNTTTNLAEYYTGTDWKPIDAPPTITGISPSSPIDDGATTTLIGNDGTSYNVSSFSVDSATTITFDYTSALAAAGVNQPYSIKYQNTSGLFGQLDGALTPDTAPAWVTTSGSLGTIDKGEDVATAGLTTPLVATNFVGTLSYTVTTGTITSG